MIELAEKLLKSAAQLKNNPSAKAVEAYVVDSVAVMEKLASEFVVCKAAKELAESELKSLRAEIENQSTSAAKQKRIGDIHIGGEILPEFNSDKWCKDCGAPVENLHLRNCPAVNGDTNG